MSSDITIGSLFSGIGGIELGFHRAGGFKTAWFVERGLYAQTILKKRFPNTPVYADIETLDFSTIPQVDLLTGGFPCQDISNAGKRIGIAGNRSSLWKQYLRAISELRPQFAFIENVAALLIRGLSVVLCDLTKIGYDAEWYCVPASAIGAHHQRDRVFIISYPHNKGQQGKREIEAGLTKLSKEDVENSHSIRQQDSRDEGNNRIKERKLEKRKWKLETNGTTTSSEFRQRGMWSVEPELGRVAHGIPNRVDRLKCLGNAVVPQVAEIFAKAIKKQIKNRS